MKPPISVLHVRCPTTVRDRLRDHAYDLSRTLAVEVVMWLEAGAAMSAYASTIDPRASMTITDPAELAELRDQALEQVQLALARVLPTPVAPDAVLDSLTPSLN